MKNLQFKALNHLFFIGIGGISMSALAKLMVNYGKKVSGSDQHFTPLIARLQQLGIEVFAGHDASHVAPDVDLVVFTGAIAKDNVEKTEAEKRGIVTMERSEFLGWVAKEYDTVVSVAGTHGKTTTTAMIGTLLQAAHKNPTIHVGGEVVGLGNLRVGGKKWLVTEACEYKKSLTFLQSKVACITNIEKDHMDCYKTYDDLLNTFRQFAFNSDALFLDAKLKNQFSHPHCITVGKGGDWEARKLKEVNHCSYCFDAYYKGHFFGHFILSVWGKYQVLNALFAIAVANYFSVPLSTMQQNLQNFAGIKRRNEKLGTVGQKPVFSDYGHHPSQILQSIATFQKKYHRVLVVFQPHTYSRTITLKKEFVPCFKKAFKLIIYATYAAREEPMAGGTAKDLFNFIHYPIRNKMYADNAEQLKEQLAKWLPACRAVLILGAGDLVEQTEQFLTFDANL